MLLYPTHTTDLRGRRVRVQGLGYGLSPRCDPELVPDDMLKRLRARLRAGPASRRRRAALRSTLPLVTGIAVGLFAAGASVGAVGRELLLPAIVIGILLEVLRRRHLHMGDPESIAAAFLAERRCRHARTT